MRRCARLRSQIAGAIGVNLRVVKDRRGIAKDEVDAALDIGVDVILPAVVGEERVLVPEEPAVLEDGAVGTQ